MSAAICDCPKGTTKCLRGSCPTIASLLEKMQPIVFLPLMTKPAREVEKGTKYLPEVWKPNG